MNEASDKIPETMRIAAITGVQEGGLIEVPLPRPKNDIVVVKLHSIPMCTEYGAFRNGAAGSDLGHEAAGEVAFIDKATRFKVGDRVLVQPQSPCGVCALCAKGDFIHCQNQRDYKAETGSTYGTGTMGEYMLKSEAYLTPIPEGLSYDHASMALCALGPTFTAMERMGVGPFDTVFVSGLGPVGLGAVINATFRGARVIGADTNPYRAALAKKLGAELVVDPTGEHAAEEVRDFTKGGANCSVETSGVAASKKLLLDVLLPKGRAALVGWNGALDASTIIGKGLSVFGAWHYNLADAYRVLEVAARSTQKLDQLITHRFPLADIAEAWRVQLTGRCGKIILHP